MSFFSYANEAESGALIFIKRLRYGKINPQVVQATLVMQDQPL
jgi:hypothetical protein